LKITIITVVYNAEKYLKDCIESVLSQTYSDLEYILIDGQSSDSSFQIAKQYEQKMALLISEPDRGMYDALNKGISLATGEIIGILNADDMLSADHVIDDVAKAFMDSNVDAVYGDLNYVDPEQTDKIQRRWRSKQASYKDLAWGWMPAHPTLYIRSSLFEKFGGYQLDYGSAADYELMLRYFYQHKIAARYVPTLMVNMRSGGMSNQSWKHRYQALLNDFKALQNNKVHFPTLALLFKKLRKINQFF
jgi:glycosyltransferase involved in cell wall biosynthesis